jgi:hypothetical protein
MVSPRGIVRIGDAARRPLRPLSLTVQAYLTHLHDAGSPARRARTSHYD